MGIDKIIMKDMQMYEIRLDFLQLADQPVCSKQIEMISQAGQIRQNSRKNPFFSETNIEFIFMMIFEAFLAGLAEGIDFIAILPGLLSNIQHDIACAGIIGAVDFNNCFH